MRTHRSLLLPALLGTLALVAVSCGDDDDDDDAAGTESTDAESTSDAAACESDDVPDGPAIVIGAQDFGESAILSEVYGQCLEAAGYSVQQQSLGGFRDLVYTSFESGDINFTAEYAASALEFLNGFAGEATSDIDETAELFQAQLDERDLTAFDASPAVDSNSFVVTQETADDLGLSKVSDLTDDMTLGGPPDCPDNASCIPGLIETYGLDLSDRFVPLDGGGPLTVAALDGGEIDVAILFSTDGVIADKGWVVLEDDQGLINADNIIPVASDDVAEAYGEAFASLVNAISAALTTEELTELNRQFNVDKEDADVVATGWLESEGFLG